MPRNKYTIEDAHRLASDHNGKCLSSELINTKRKIRWQCENGHIWEAPFCRIKRGCWCLHCYGKQWTLQDMQDLAHAKGGKCLSEKYINTQTPLEWECKVGHRWKTPPSNITGKGHWCYYCARIKNGLKKRKTISDLQKMAEANGGKCLSEICKGTLQKHLWQCADGHIWEAIPSSIQQGSWCPICHRTNENKCRFILEQLLNTPFPKTRKIIPPFELDGYSDKHKIAFEFQGQQHYTRIWFHKSENDFKRQKERDKQKLRLCSEKNIKIILIPYWLCDSDLSMVNFIIGELNQLSVLNIHSVDWSKYGEYSSCIKLAKKIVSERGGKLLQYRHDDSKIMLSSNRLKLKLECVFGHQWETSFYNLKCGHWCINCHYRKCKAQRFNLLSTQK